MDNKESSLLKRVGGKVKMILILIMTIIITLVSVGMYTLRDFGLGYGYYENNVMISVTQEENLIDKTVREYLETIENEGYIIVSNEFNQNIFLNSMIIQKSQIDNDIIIDSIKKSIDVEIFATKLNIQNDTQTYYFQSETKCNDFVKELNEYIEQAYTTESDIIEYHEITSQETLNTKLEEVKNQKAELDKQVAAKKAAELAKKTQVTSRGGMSSRTSSAESSILACYNYISSPYGMRHGKMHTGVDFASPAGTSIYAWKSGTVVNAHWNGGYGNFIEIQHNDGTVSRYAHLSGYAVSQGTYVSAGQTIGYVGTTGNSTGNHLHFEIKVNGDFVNPLNYL